MEGKGGAMGILVVGFVLVLVGLGGLYDFINMGSVLPIVLAIVGFIGVIFGLMKLRAAG